MRIKASISHCEKPLLTRSKHGLASAWGSDEGEVAPPMPSFTYLFACFEIGDNLSYYRLLYLDSSALLIAILPS